MCAPFVRVKVVPSLSAAVAISSVERLKKSYAAISIHELTLQIFKFANVTAAAALTCLQNRNKPVNR